jgi:hypothetical protein
VAVSRALRGNGFNQGYREFGRLTTFLASGDHFMVADNASYEIQVYTVAGALESIFRRRSDPVPITGGDIEALRAPRLSNQGEAGRRALEGYFSDLPDPPETMPHFGSQLHVDRTGNLWVIEYERPTESRHRRWTVFDTQGRWLTTFRLPDGFDLMDVGQDWVLGRVRDEFDVEYIQLYELIKEK